MRSFLFIGYSLFLNAQLPKNWEGHYAGTLHAQQSNGSEQAYHMELIFNSITDSIYTWTIVYGEDSLKQERKYTLKQTGEKSYVIDENNGIVLSSNLIGNQFISVFEVQGNLIHSVYQFEKDKIIFTLTSSYGKMETGGEVEQEDETVLNNEEIPIVYTYKTGTVQYAELKRIKK